MAAAIKKPLGEGREVAIAKANLEVVKQKAVIAKEQVVEAQLELELELAKNLSE